MASGSQPHPALTTRRVVVVLVIWLMLVVSYITFSMITAAHSQGKPPRWAPVQSIRR